MKKILVFLAFLVISSISMANKIEKMELRYSNYGIERTIIKNEYTKTYPAYENIILWVLSFVLSVVVFSKNHDYEHQMNIDQKIDYDMYRRMGLVIAFVFGTTLSLLMINYGIPQISFSQGLMIFDFLSVAIIISFIGLIAIIILIYLLIESLKTASGILTTISSWFCVIWYTSENPKPLIAWIIITTIGFIFGYAIRKKPEFE